MLVLSRKKDEKIILRLDGHEDIELTVVRIDNLNKIRLGIDAPSNVTIIRSELDEQFDKKMKVASVRMN